MLSRMRGPPGVDLQTLHLTHPLILEPLTSQMKQSWNVGVGCKDPVFGPFDHTFSFSWSGSSTSATAAQQPVPSRAQSSPQVEDSACSSSPPLTTAKSVDDIPLADLTALELSERGLFHLLPKIKPEKTAPPIPCPPPAPGTGPPWRLDCH